MLLPWVFNGGERDLLWSRARGAAASIAGSSRGAGDPAAAAPPLPDRDVGGSDCPQECIMREAAAAMASSSAEDGRMRHAGVKLHRWVVVSTAPSRAPALPVLAAVMH